MKRNLLAAAAALALACSQVVAPAWAQNIQPLDLPTTNGSQTITSGNTYQQLLAALGFGVDSQRKSLTIQNNNTNGDNCYLAIGAVPLAGAAQIVAGTTTASSNITVGGATVTAQQASILLQPGGSYTRYLPNIPSDAIFATCATSGDSVYVDTQ
jgi:hypothetical protein